MSQIVAQAAVSIFPTFKGLRSATAKEAGRQGRLFGQRFSRQASVGAASSAADVLRPFKRAVARATDTLAKARRQEADAAARAAIAEKRLEEVLARSGEHSSQAMAAAHRLEKARRDLADATARVAEADAVLAERNAAMGKALEGSADRAQNVMRRFGALGSRVRDMGRRFLMGFKDIEAGNSLAGGISGSLGALTRSLANLYAEVFKQTIGRFVDMGKIWKSSMGVMSQGLSRLRPLVSKVGEVFSRLGSIASGFAGKIGRVLNGAISPFASFGRKVFDAVAPGLSAIGKAFVPVGQSLAALGSKIATRLGIDLKGGMGSLGGIVSAGFKGVHSAFGAGVNALASAARGVGSIVGGAVAGAMTAITATIGANMRGAISRVDTLNNFPRVMKNMGFTTDEAARSIKKLDQNIQGLPTSLDEIVQMTQGIAPLEKGLDRSTDLALALNNALIAGGHGAEGASRGMRQYTQMFAKQAVDMQSWRIMMEVMPGQLHQMAKALLGPTANAQQLYDAMRDGNVTFDQFNDTLIALNKDGVDGFASFEEQARDATKGIATSLSLLGTAVKRNIGKVLQTIGIENIMSGLGRVRDGIDAVGAKVVQLVENFRKMGGGSFAKAFASLKPLGVAFAPIIGALSGLLRYLPLVGRLFAGLTGPVGLAIGVIVSLFTQSEKLREAFAGAFKAISKEIEGLGFSLDGAAGGISDLIGQIGDAIAPVVEQIGQFVAQWIPQFVQTLSGFWEGLKQSFEGIQPSLAQLWDSLSTVLQSLWEALEPIVEFIGQLFAVLWQIVSAVFPPLVDFIASVAPLIAAVVTVIGELISVLTPLLQPLGSLVSAILPSLISLFTSVLAPIFEVGAEILEHLTPAIQGIKQFLQGLIDFVTGVFTGNWKQALNGLVQAFTGMVNTIGSLVWGALATVFYNIPKMIYNVFAGAGTWLIGIGRSIIDGLINGIYSAFASVRSALGELTSMLPEWKGPASLDRVILKKPAELIMTGFIDSMEAKYADAKKSLQTFTNTLQPTIPGTRHQRQNPLTQATTGTNTNGITVNQYINVANVPDASDLASQAAQEQRIIRRVLA